MYVKGVTRAGTGKPVTARTPFYVASQTKHYLGLLAAVLHERGVLSLDMTLAQAWPEIRLPENVDPAKITLTDLLVHRAPFRTPVLNYRTAYADAIPVEQYPEFVAKHSSARKPGFSYDNLGYLMYAAILERRTGRSWHDWMEREIFKPLRLNNTSTRASRFRANQLVWRHQWRRDQWVPLPPKADATMHAAGGVFTSSEDLAKWLQAFLKEKGRGRLTQAVFRRATQPVFKGDPQQENGFGCSGYALGWFVCNYGGDELLLHAGVMDGVRSIAAFAPRKGYGIAVSVASDSFTAALAADLVRVFYDSLNGLPDAEQKARAVAAGFVPKPEQMAKSRVAALEKDTKSDRWGGWTWSPQPELLHGYVGLYRNEEYGEFRVVQEGGSLIGRLGEQAFRFKPAQVDTFAGSENPLKRPEKFVFERDGQGRLTQLKWGKDVFVRVGGGS
jgi:CubicO group peptidase (beta-lactamase class C family)